MAFRLTNAAASAGVDSTGLKGYIGSNPVLRFYTGTVNANAESAPTGTLLATVTIGSFGSASNGTITSSGGSSTVSATGTVGCFTLSRSDSTKVGDGSASAASSSDIVFDNASWVSGGTVSISSFSLTLPPH